MFSFKVELREAVSVSNLLRTYCIGSLLACIVWMVVRLIACLLSPDETCPTIVIV